MGELQGEMMAGENAGVLQHVFKQYDRHGKGELMPHEVQSLHGDIRMGGISYPQVLASMKYTCATHDTCTQDELYDLLQEMDRRYFLLQDLRWEFSLLDRDQRDTITIEQARWMVQAVHGKNFSKRKWSDFLRNRAIPGTGVAFQEIEVLLCNVKSSLDVLKDREDEERERREGKIPSESEREERERLAEEEALMEKERQRRLREEERRRKEESFVEEEDKVDGQVAQTSQDDSGSVQHDEVKSEEKQRLEDEARRKMMEEEDERRRLQRQKEEEERLLEEQRLRQLEEEEARRRQDEMEKYKDAEKILEDTSEKEKDLEEQLRIVREKLKVETDEKKRKELEEEEQRLLKLLYDLKHKRIRYSLKVAIKEKDKYQLNYSINEFKTEKVEDVDMDLEKAEKLLREITSRDNLRKAMSRREIEELEKAINVIKKNGLEVQLARELRDANEILARLRKIQRIRSEILELKQSTVAEIRSYQKPPPVVHTVMTATFLILGHQEKETKDWKNIQALVGKTGKDGLKRRCLECNAAKISTAAAARAKELLDKQELDEVRDVSAGAATFYVFSVAMVEEAIDLAERGPIEPETSDSRVLGAKPKIDPTKMVISRSKQMVTTSGPNTRSRSKTPTRKK
ncbi:trichohyalin-like isoform X1 [Mercenaria mercenaria]|uniref:trichohyalin-like isoform X1 n=1 Tax=Mercenaria mercenaria TaxID=6596 RepID=UPI00234F9234|nr:trichohyalin-like isoform X1 [Mercenaria mercenaria]XP_053393944.1 trichohyalin-like isoform X1 [Mercenaria mercenaria]